MEEKNTRSPRQWLLDVVTQYGYTVQHNERAGRYNVRDTRGNVLMTLPEQRVLGANDLTKGIVDLALKRLIEAPKCHECERPLNRIAVKFGDGRCMSCLHKDYDRWRLTKMRQQVSPVIDREDTL